MDFNRPKKYASDHLPPRTTLCANDSRVLDRGIFFFTYVYVVYQKEYKGAVLLKVPFFASLTLTWVSEMPQFIAITAFKPGTFGNTVKERVILFCKRLLTRLQ